MRGSALHPCTRARWSCRLPSEGSEGGELTIKILICQAGRRDVVRRSFPATMIGTAQGALAKAIPSAHPPGDLPSKAPADDKLVSAVVQTRLRRGRGIALEKGVRQAETGGRGGAFCALMRA